MIDISIIVPIYNVEKYLPKCLDSLVSQTLKNIEIILVNDASPDQSDLIMKEYEKRYSNIKCIYFKKNRCLGGARNAGVEAASGNYLLFVDSDDYIDCDYCSKLFYEAEKAKSDFVFSAFRFVDENGKNLGEKWLYPIEFQGNITEEKRKGFINKGAFACGKLFRTYLWKEKGITFPEHIKYEDAPTIPLFMMYAQRCSYVADSYYSYLKRENSITNKTDTSFPEDAKCTALLFLTRMKERGLFKTYEEEIEHFITERYYSVFIKRCLTMYTNIPYTKLRETKEELYQLYPDFWNNKYIYSFVAEDMLRMKMNDISEYTAASWEKNQKDTMLNDDIFCSSIYYSFYKSKKNKIKRLFILYQKKTIYIAGNKQKKKAFKHLITNELSEVSIKEEMCSLNGALIIVVNPSACIQYKFLYKDNIVINLEDYLNGYIEYGGES